MIFLSVIFSQAVYLSFFRSVCLSVCLSVFFYLFSSFVTEKEAGEDVFAVALVVGETRSAGDERDSGQTKAEEGTQDENPVTLRKERWRKVGGCGLTTSDHTMRISLYTCRGMRMPTRISLHACRRTTEYHRV